MAARPGLVGEQNRIVRNNYIRGAYPTPNDPRLCAPPNTPAELNRVRPQTIICVHTCLRHQNEFVGSNIETSRLRTGWRGVGGPFAPLALQNVGAFCSIFF